jgi:hypothetical protein
LFAHVNSNSTVLMIFCDKSPHESLFNSFFWSVFLLSGQIFWIGSMFSEPLGQAGPCPASSPPTSSSPNIKFRVYALNHFAKGGGLKTMSPNLLRPSFICGDAVVQVACKPLPFRSQLAGLQAFLTAKSATESGIRALV